MQFSALIREISRGCFHRRVAWPQHNRQRCLVCGGWRIYDLNRGIQGEWKQPEEPQSEPSLGSSHSSLQPGVRKYSVLPLNSLNMRDSQAPRMDEILSLRHDLTH